MVIHGHDQDILVDAGFSLRELRRRMSAAAIDEGRLAAILVSHEHADHSKGIGVVARKLDLPVFCTRDTAMVLRERNLLGDRINLFPAGGIFDLAGFKIQAFSIPHDAIDPVGFTFCHEQIKIGIATDLGHPSSVVCHHLGNCDILVVESNHDIAMLHESQRPWRLKQRIMGRHGHLSNSDSMSLLGRLLHRRTKHLILAHASCECNDYGLLAELAGNLLGESGRPDVTYHIATQDGHLPTVWI